MSKISSSKFIIEELSKEGIEPLKLKRDSLNKIVEIYNDTMRIRGTPPIKMTKKEYIKMQNQETKESVKELRKYLQKIEELKKHRSNDPIIFGFAYS